MLVESTLSLSNATVLENFGFMFHRVQVSGPDPCFCVSYMCLGSHVGWGQQNHEASVRALCMDAESIG